MKRRTEIKFFLFTASLILSGVLNAREGHEESPHYEWIDGQDVAVCEDGIYIGTVKGMMQLNVVDYDRINDRYQVRCSCLEKPWLDPYENLGIPPEKSLK